MEADPFLGGAPVDWNDPASVFGALGGGSGTKLPIPKTISPELVVKQANEHIARIFSDRELLNGILDRHEAVIYRRWSKKTKRQRVDVLLAAWPNMSPAHRPDFLAFKKEGERERETGTKFREAYLWPYINLEDLSRAKTFPLFLQTRARNTPDVFALADRNAAHLGYVTKAIIPHFLNQHTMMFTNRKTPETYGKLISWEENDDAFEWLMSGKGMHPGDGLLTLEIQQRITHFLVECCKRIMHDIPPGELASDSYPVDAPVALTGDTFNGFSSLAIMAAEAPYRSPTNMDLVRLESLIGANKSAAEDHVWALREDPGYFAGALLEVKEHRLEMLSDTEGCHHPVLKPANQDVFWQRIIGNVVTEAHLKVEVWSELHAQIQALCSLQAKHRDNISIDKALPEEYLNALLRFRHYLAQAAKAPNAPLRHSAISSPPMRHLYARVPPKDPSSSQIEIVQKPQAKLEKGQAELIWLLRTLWEDGNDLFLIGLPTVVDELERHTQSEPKAKMMLSACVARLLSDLAAFSEAIRQLDTYQPWAQTFEDLLVDRRGAIEEEFARHTSAWSFVGAALEGPNQARIVQLGTPGKKFDYPVDRRRTEENVQAMRSAEQALDAFWSSVDQNMRARAGRKLEETALWQLLSQPRTLQRTPEWVEPDEQVKRKQNGDISAVTKPLSELYLDLEQRTERTVDHSARPARSHTTKTKTRGAPAPFGNGPSEGYLRGVEPAIPVATQPAIIRLDARALKVFRTLFYTPSLDATPGEVAWTDFLHAMVAAGFEPEKLYGSAWQFRPTKLDVERSIQFHEPHPSGKLPYRFARRFGRRLERAYGWRGAIFVPEEAVFYMEKE